MSKRISIFMVLATVFALGLMTVAPVAFAGPKGDSETSDHGQGSAPGQAKKAEEEDTSADAGDKDGDADSDPNTAYTEDNDTNDGTANNVADEGDNQHPSGKDKSVENGGSGNQGRSESNPDDTNGPMRSEGQAGSPDKPNGFGGEDLADQDGNNGCGNDDDFDDDNNGWCGKPADEDDDVEGEVIVDKPCDADATMPGTQPCHKEDDDDDDDVLGGVINNPGRTGGRPLLPEVVTNPATPEDEVLGEIITRDINPAVAGAAIAPAVQAEGATLPFTGGQILSFVAAGLGLITAGGTALVVRSKK